MNKEKTVSEAIKNRRSVRVFSKNELNTDKVKNCIYNASLAHPKWDFLK